ncbi:winged helix-turn-helix transcriptional regulator [Eggerthella lenta]|nr:winged helix-turn-helix transcriptional regulator [Eggerthella lenta]
MEYSLTERGMSLMPVLDELCLWGEAHRNDEVPSSGW